MLTYLTNTKDIKFVLSNSTTENFVSLHQILDINGNYDVISDFKVQPESNYFTLDNSTHTLSFNLK
jgi:hypothetical protein